MRPLCARDEGGVSRRGRMGWCLLSHRSFHGFGPHDFQPMAPDLTPWPISPTPWRTRDRLKPPLGTLTSGGTTCTGLIDRDGPETSADPWWVVRGTTFLRLCTPVAHAAIPNAS